MTARIFSTKSIIYPKGRKLVMKLQTSGVLGTSYAIAKLAPKRGISELEVTNYLLFMIIGGSIY